MVAQIPEPSVLEGSIVRLEPMTAAHLPELFSAIGRPEVFASGYGGGPAGLPHTLGGFEQFARGYYVWDGSGRSFVARLSSGPREGEVVGTSTLSDLDVVNEHVHLGWTAWSPSVWGTGVNPEAKLLMIDHAFANGFGRVKLQADVLNERSQAAIRKLGATFEGVTRRDKRRADGTWRDAAVFSIVVEEWPELRARLAARVASAPRP